MTTHPTTPVENEPENEPEPAPENEPESESGPGAGPAPRVLTEAELSRLLGEQQFGVLASVRRTGHPHLTTVLYSWDAEERVVRVSSTADRLKPRQLRTDPHAALHVHGQDVFSFAVAEGEAEVSVPAAVPGDAVSRELLSLTPGFEDPAEEAAFLAQVVADRRVVIRIRVSRLYGTALDIPAAD
ncbi:pyridoxamine 5'-phosphate oxidase family protein [Streptomyces poriferorum]|uniref:TIGR03618 family F420-dependent PPOX class oxidoreductase n=1 Tax=Streptomyces poriferorum TaxID=2798799 RepID=A0ABY9ISA2_9ACTN|nr:MULTISPECIES: TIGR03618 family F420-dependent PPOX class oxidoreductase [unclassified Streptomyces]MDP5313603.1 TIGR03618 family F420-dependent PPOX class oxidoreductase [Streptomyces sp. Alt4]WLQ57431.1 TIGR03618 family F420-dependent PPOX class oxidoreductase [Streptomyces sp. Alt2]